MEVLLRGFVLFFARLLALGTLSMFGFLIARYVFDSNRLGDSMRASKPLKTRSLVKYVNKANF